MKISVLWVALCMVLSTTTAAFGVGLYRRDGVGIHNMPITGGALGTSAATPGTNSLGTALSTSDVGSGRPQKGPLLGTGPAIAGENAKVEKAIRSICRGC